MFYFRFEFSSDLKKHLNEWKSRKDRTSKLAQKVKALEISQIHSNLDKHFDKIKVLISICPLLGLLGTVTGMISVFEIMSQVGTGNARIMARGISMATIPTMAGMLIALIGLYCSSQLEYFAKLKKQKVRELFSMD